MAFLNRRVYLLAMLITLVAAYLTATNGETATEQQCYWCGPLAEEVHNSRRTAPCQADKQLEVTKCNHDQPYCAVVVTAPPYTESRICTRYYQDECYARYCNTSKIWRMACSCKGALCNGAITEREYEAFSSIINLVAKTHNKRIKRDWRNDARVRDVDQPMFQNTRQNMFFINRTRNQKTLPENEAIKPTADDNNSSQTFSAKSYVLPDNINMSLSHNDSFAQAPGPIGIAHSTFSTQIGNIQNLSQIMTSPTTITGSSNKSIITPKIKINIDDVQNDQAPEDESILTPKVIITIDDVEDDQAPEDAPAKNNYN